MRGYRGKPVESRFPERNRQAIDTYREGVAIEAVDSVLALDAGSSQGVHRAVGLVDKGLRGDSTAVVPFLEAASMRHFDAALRCWEVANEHEARSQIKLARRWLRARRAMCVDPIDVLRAE